jgi:protein Hikeshi
MMNNKNNFTATTLQSNNAYFNAVPQQPAFAGIIFSGCPVRTDFIPVDASGLKFACRLACPGDVPSPLASVTDIALFLLPNMPLPPSHGVLCYWQLTAAASTTTGGEPVSTGFELLGAITPDRPSNIFYTGWGEHEQLIDLAASGLPVVLTIGLSLEPLVNISNLLSTDNNSNTRRLNNRLSAAQGIGTDLFRFMQSFDTGNAGGAGNIVVPANIFDRWLERFNNRLRRNPNFFIKQEQPNGLEN